MKTELFGIYRLRRFFTSTWMPTALALTVLAVLLGQFAVTGIVWLSRALEIVLLFSLVSILGAGIFQFAAKAWKKGLLSLLLFLGTAAVSFVSVIAVYLIGLPDYFGWDIVIPPDMVLEQPRDMMVAADRLATDVEGNELIDVYAAGTMASGDAALSIDLDIMNRFKGANRGLLLRHLASSAKWFVTEERGKVYAYRRFVTEKGGWKGSLAGYYTAHDFNKHQGRHFQVRIILGIDGPVLDGPWHGQVTDVTVSSAKSGFMIGTSVNRYDESTYVSYLVLRSDGPALEIFEEAKSRSRAFTVLALSKFKAELSALGRSQAARRRGFDPALMPPRSVKQGDPDFYLVNGFQGGLYSVYAYVNPGEEGRLYLKVFEATRNTPLSKSRIAERSTEYLGWSDDPAEVFFYNTRITVYEGSWGIYYPARFELWFSPASGEPERKLLEKIYMIEGWER